jgi:primary-amine oxidase
VVALFCSYYEQGYKDGFDHGRLHGLFEGRAIGQEKAYEIWEEVGFMEGMALFWQSVATKQAEGQSSSGKKVTSR